MKKLLVITGPTASGKSALGIQLAKQLNGEIISADSMQIYKHMDIGTAKETDLTTIKHHMIDVITPDQKFSVKDYQIQARACVADIVARNKQPIVVGGTGFYINALLYDVHFEGDPDFAYREELVQMAKQEGNTALYQKLVRIDPEYARTIHENNVAKIARALEYHHTTGNKLSEHNAKEAAKPPHYNSQTLIANMARERLYDRINQRVDLMLEQGLIAEVEGLLARGYAPELPAMGSIGYKETVNYIKGKITKTQLAEDIKQNSRNYAKRQLTWLKNKTQGTWLDIDAPAPVWQQQLDHLVNAL